MSRRFPKTVPYRSPEESGEYRRDESGFVVKGEREGLAVFGELPAEGMLLCDGRPPDSLAAGDWAPLYRRPAGPPSVLTGRAFVWAGSAEAFDGCLAAIEAAGFVVESRPRSAPGGAWLTPAGDDWASALESLAELAEIAELSIVQPEAKTVLQKRGGHGGD